MIFSKKFNFISASLIVLINTSSAIAEQEDRVIKFDGDSRETQFKKVSSSSDSRYNDNDNAQQQDGNRYQKNKYNENEQYSEDNRPHYRRERYNDNENNDNREYRQQREYNRMNNSQQQDDQTRYKKYVNSNNEVEYVPVINNRESSNSVWSDGTVIIELDENVNVKSFARKNGLDFLKQNKNGKYIFKIEDETEVVHKCNELLKVRGVIDARPNWRRENRHLK